MAAISMDGSPQQHMQALRQANKVRLARSALKKKVNQGELPVAAVIETCPEEAETMTISDLLLSQRRWGSQRVRMFLKSVPMSETRRLGCLTARERGELVARLSPSEAASADRTGLWPAWAA